MSNKPHDYDERRVLRAALENYRDALRSFIADAREDGDDCPGVESDLQIVLALLEEE